ncbi:hypothetical protein [Pseudomonas sp. TNT2022 ID642]|uniref:hypothetical protein n=1 Tax=Pseudomonas sp. TNT2022 ID642 TaxID=2942632 RepID=UPI00235F236B|nr:hypothetical protein [Pseudomonas sp. TNT2022 ID642]MDD1003370.1 hypothetical protein [Pseudomonas sp. TNT2022 ID642]
MSPKLPAKGTLTSNTPTRATQSSSSNPRTPNNPQTVVASSSTSRPGETSGTPVRTDLQPRVTVSRSPTGAAMVSKSARRPLEDYWICADVRLPAADTQGFRIVKGRRYVDVPDGHSVLVAIDPDMGLYRATLTSERDPSGPVLQLDPQSKIWRPLPASGETLLLRSADDLNAELDGHTKMMDESAALARELQSAWYALNGQEGERTAIVKYEVQYHRHLAAVDKCLDFYLREQISLLLYQGITTYEADLFKIQLRRFETLCRIMRAGDRRKLIDMPPRTQVTPEQHRSNAGYLKGKLALLRKRQIIADELLHKSQYNQNVFSEWGYDPMEIYKDTADWMQSKCQVLAAEQRVSSPLYLSLSFSETTLAFLDVDAIPLEARIPVLSDLLEQCTSIKNSFEHLETPSGSVHASYRQEIVDAISSFENTLEDRLALYHRDLESVPLLPSSDQSIDFDFIPAQRANEPESMPTRMFRSKHNGVHKIRLGRPRRGAADEELMDVMHPHKPAEILQTYERREGEWHRRVATPKKSLSKLTTEAEQHLAMSDQYLREAWQKEAAKHNASGIVDELVTKAIVLDDLIPQIEKAPNPSAINVGPVLQRLRQDSQRLRNDAEAIRIRLFKDKSYLSADRVVHLISLDELRVKRIQRRQPLGKGANKEFLDTYLLSDRHTGERLWEAHFHYPEAGTPARDFNDRGGHLKTLDQARKGVSSQRRDEQAGRPHVAIWRLTLDRKTAQKIFDLAS